MRQLRKDRQCKILTAFAVLLLGILLFTSAPDTACAEDGDTAITEWQELQNRIDAYDSGTIYLDKDYKAADTDTYLTLAKGKNLTIDLRGHTLDRNAPGPYSEDGLAMRVFGTLKIIDTKSGGKITGAQGYDGAFEVDGGSLTMNSGTLTGNYAWSTGTVNVINEGTFILNGGTISGNVGESAGGVCIEKGSFLMTGGAITDNSGYHSGGVFLWEGTFDMSGGTIRDNEDATCGGVLIDQGTFTMSNGVISNNSGRDCYGVMLSYYYGSENDTVFTLSGGTIEGKNTWESRDSSGIFVRDGTFNLSGNPTINSTDCADIYLNEGERINVTSPLDKALSLSVSTKVKPAEGAPVTITSGLQSRGDIFNFYSFEDYGVGADSAGEAVLGTPALDIIYKAGRGSGSDIKKKGIQDYRYTLEDCTFEPPAGMKFKGWIFWSNPTVYPAGHTYKLNSSKRLTAQYDCISHDWSEPNYEWTENHAFVTATRTCGVGGETETETAAAAETITEPTCTQTGLKTYTSETFENSAFSVQTETETIDAIGHNWGAWKVTKKPTALNTGTKQRVCENDPSHVQKQNIPATGVSGTLLAKMTPSGSKSLNVTWTKVKGAEGYDIFFARCNAGGKEIVCKKVKTVKGNKTFKWSRSGLKKQTAYKVYVKAFAAKNGKKTYIRTSPVMHAFTGGYDKKYTNAKAVTLKKTTVTLKKGTTYQIKAGVTKLKAKKTLMGKGHAAKLRYLSSNKKIATVSKSGKITAKAKGTCTVYVYAHNGVSKTIKVTVR